MHRCFAMEKLNRTLHQVVQDQDGKLSKLQQSQIIDLLKELSVLGIRHNDSNICKIHVMLYLARCLRFAF